MHAVSFHTYIDIQHKGTAPTQFGPPDNIEARQLIRVRRLRLCHALACTDSAETGVPCAYAEEHSLPNTPQARLKETFPGGFTTDREEFKKWLKDLGPSPSAPGSIKRVRNEKLPSRSRHSPTGVLSCAGSVHRPW